MSENTDTNDFQELKPHYVYELINSLTNEVFYVGKGQGDRAYAHVKETPAGNGQETKKTQTIRAIENNGDKIKIRVIGRYRTGVEAFAVESTLIHWIHGKENLTNDQNGHGADSIRGKGDYGQLPNIDIPETIRSFDGSYSLKFEEARDQNNIIPFMEDLKKYLEGETGYQFSDIDVSKSRFTTINYVLDNVYIQFCTSNNSSKKQIQIFVKAKTGKKEDKVYVETIANHSEFVCRNSGEYAKWNDYINFSNFEETLEGFKFILGKLEDVIIHLPQ